MQPLVSTDPRRFGHYRLDGVLGRGGQGTVYLGQNSSGIKVAVKVINAQTADDQNARRRFTREAEAAGSVAAFCTARVLDAGIADGRPYIVSEFIAGPALDRLVQQDGVRSGSGLERLAVATLTALAAIHRAGIVHRDFKPSNVVMGAEGPVVIDFGIARTLDQTVTSTVIGTPAFMAPEQFDGGAVGPEADLFSWAGTMVFAATGRSAFTGDTTPAQMRAILDGEPELTGVQAALRPVLEKCLAKDPRQRPTADEVLRWLTGEPGGAQATTVRVTSRYPTFEPPKTRLLEEDAPTQVDQAPDADRRPNAPLAIAAAAVMTIAGLLGIATIAGKAALSSASYGGFFLSIALLGVAVWRSNTAARVALCLTVPCGLVFAYWVTLEDWSFPNVLLSVVPLSLAGVSTVLAAALLRRASMTAIAFGVTTGALLVFSQVLVLVTSLMTVELSEAFLVFWRVVDTIGCVSSSAWTILLGVAAARRAQA